MSPDFSRKSARDTNSDRTSRPDYAAPLRVLILTSDPAAAKSWEYGLQRAGFTVKIVDRDRCTAEEIWAWRTDVLLLDVRQANPGLWRRCRSFRNDPRLMFVRILAIGAPRDSESIAAILAAGAHDALPYPCALYQIASHISGLAVSRGESDAKDLKVGSLTVSPGRVRVFVRSQPVAGIPFRAFRILQVLASQPGRVWTREQILEAISDGLTRTSSRTVDVHISLLRRLLASWNGQIETIRGVGYRLLPDEPEKGTAPVSDNPPASRNCAADRTSSRPRVH